MHGTGAPDRRTMGGTPRAIAYGYNRLKPAA